MHAVVRSACVLAVLSLMWASCSSAKSGPKNFAADYVRREFKFREQALNKAAEKFLFYRDKHPFVVPLVINVGLIGLDGFGGAYNFSVDIEEFEAMLLRNLPSYQPSCMETEEQLHIQYQLTYNVVPITTFHLDSIEEAIAENLHFTGGKMSVPGISSPLPVYEADAKAVEDVIDGAYTTYFGYSDKWSRKDSKGMAPYAIIFINPDKGAMTPEPLKTLHSPSIVGVDGVPGPKFVYRYRYNGWGSMQAWMAKDRYLVIDLSAGPTQYGTTHVGEGTVSHASIPRLENILAMSQQQPSDSQQPSEAADVEQSRYRDDYDDELVDDDFWDEDHYYYRSTKKDHMTRYRDTELLSHLSSVVLTAVRQVFVPDTRFETLELPQKVVVPIVLLRNHRQFNPFDRNTYNPYFIDIPLIEHELSRIILPNQEVTFLTLDNFLFDHEQISLALSRSICSDSVNEPVGKAGRYAVKMKTYINSQVLRHEMTEAPDLLAGALIGSSHSIHHQESGGSRTIQIAGTRIVPVYVFSLVGMDPGLLIDQDSLVAMMKDMVVVLQTPNENVRTPYFVEDNPVTLDARNATQHILAGLLAVLGGVTAPHERYSPVHKRPVQDFLFTNGYNPFGPFAHSMAIPHVLTDMVLRNSVLTRLNAALRNVKHILDRIDKFANEYIYNPAGETVSSNRTSRSILDRLYHQEEKSVQSPLSHEVVENLHDELKLLESFFVTCSQHLYAFRLTEAHSLATSIMATSRTLRTYVGTELDSAAKELRCCRLQHQLKNENAHATSLWVYATIAGAGLSIYYLVLTLTAPKQQTRRKYRAH